MSGENTHSRDWKTYAGHYFESGKKNKEYIDQAVKCALNAGDEMAPVLSEYFDLVALMGKPAEAVYPNGNVMARGTFAGVDIWGRATLVTADGHEVEFSPEQARIRPA